MTKLEIIEDTVRFYSENTNRRALENGVCQYLTKDGRMCGVGRWLEIPYAYVGPVERMMDKSGKIVILENVLKDKVKGHSVNFLAEIQSLHDVNSHWNHLGLTDEGITYVNELKRKYHD